MGTYLQILRYVSIFFLTTACILMFNVMYNEKNHKILNVIKVQIEN